MSVIFQVGAAAPMQRDEALAVINGGAGTYLAIPAGAKSVRVTAEAGNLQGDLNWQFCDANPATVYGPFFMMRPGSALWSNPDRAIIPLVLQDGATPPAFVHFMGLAANVKVYVEWYATA